MRLFAVEHCGRRDDPRAERLCEQEYVGYNLVGLRRGEVTRASEARLHLVEDEEGAVLSAESRGDAQVLGPGDMHAALTLHRLDEKRGKAPGRERGSERGLVVEGDVVEARVVVDVFGLVAVGATRREGREGLSVEGPLCRQYVGAAGAQTRQLDRRLHCLSAAVGEGAICIVPAEHIAQALRQRQRLAVDRRLDEHRLLLGEVPLHGLDGEVGIVPEGQRSVLGKEVTDNSSVCEREPVPLRADNLRIEPEFRQQCRAVLVHVHSHCLASFWWRSL